MQQQSITVPTLDIIGIYVLTLWGGEGTNRLGMVHRESSIVLMVLEVYRVRQQISSVCARLRRNCRTSGALGAAEPRLAPAGGQQNPADHPAEFHT